MKSWFGNNNLLRDLRYVLVYSINSQKSFEVVQVLFFLTWSHKNLLLVFELFVLSQVLYDKIADLVGNPRVPVVLVGNKKDLEVS